MAKASKQQQESDTDEVKTIVLNDDTVNAESLNPALQALYSELGMEGEVDVTVHVSMLSSNGKSLEAGVWKGTPDEYDLQAIAREFGSGEYRVKVYVRNEDGTKPIRANKVFAWKLSPAEERRRKAALDAAANPAPVEAPMSKQELAAMIATTIAETIKTVVPHQHQPTRKEQLEELKLMAEMFRPQQSGGGDNFGKRMQEFMGFAELVKSLTPQTPVLDDDGNVKSGALLTRAFDMFMNAANRAQPVVHQPGMVPQQSAPVQPPVLNQDGSLNVVHAAPSQSDSINMEWNQAMNMLKIQLKLAMQLAEKNSDPVKFADSVFDMLPDEAIEMLRTDPNWLNKLADLNPDVLKYPAWFNAVRDALLKLEAEDTDD